MRGFCEKEINNLPDNIETIIFDSILCRDYDDGKISGGFSYPSIHKVNVKKLPKNINKIIIYDDENLQINIYDRCIKIISQEYQNKNNIIINNEYDITENFINFNKIYEYLSKISHINIDIHNHNVPLIYGGIKLLNINEILDNKIKFINECLKIIGKFHLYEYFKDNNLIYNQCSEIYDDSD